MEFFIKIKKCKLSSFTIFLLALLSINKTFCQSTICDNKLVIGRIESVLLMKENLTVDAKLDSGASMASLSAQDIQIIKKKDQLWVKFSIFTSNRHKKINLMKPFLGFVKIIKRKEENNGNYDKYALRPIVMFTICIGNQKLDLPVNLVNRSAFKYPMLIGIDALKKMQILIDVNKDHQTQPHCPN